MIYIAVMHRCRWLSRLSHQPFQNLPNKKGKRNYPIFWIRPWQTSPWSDNFCAGQKISEKRRENSRKFWEIMHWVETLDFEKNILRPKYFEIQFRWGNKWPQHFIILQMMAGCEKWQVLLLLANRQFRQLLRASYFYFRNFFSCVYLRKKKAI